MKELKYEIDYKIDTESIDSMCDAGRFNPAMTLEYGGRQYTLTNGSSDDLSIYKDNDTLLILGCNTAMGYCSLSEITTTDNDFNCADDLLFFDEHQLDEVGINIYDTSDKELIQSLCKFL